MPDDHRRIIRPGRTRPPAPVPPREPAIRLGLGPVEELASRRRLNIEPVILVEAPDAGADADCAYLPRAHEHVKITALGAGATELANSGAATDVPPELAVSPPDGLTLKTGGFAIISVQHNTLHVLADCPGYGLRYWLVSSVDLHSSTRRMHVEIDDHYETAIQGPVRCIWHVTDVSRSR